MTRTRIHNLSISLDGFATGEGQRADAPMGHAGRRLHEWMFATRFGASIVGAAGGSEGTDYAIARLHEPGIGAEIMGAGKFGPPGWQDDADWKGWWGPNPPFHTPTFVLTHRPRPPIEMEGGTTFHFLARLAGRGPRRRAGGSGRPGRAHRWRPDRGPRLHRGGARRPRPPRPGADRARPRGAAVGRPRSARGGLRRRGGLDTQRRHPPHLHPVQLIRQYATLRRGALGAPLHPRSQGHLGAGAESRRMRGTRAAGASWVQSKECRWS